MQSAWSFLAALFLAQTASIVDDVLFAPLRDHCQRLVKALEARKAPLPEGAAKELQRLLRDGTKDPMAAAKIQQLLDQHCLCVVTINPESRVKAARGPLSPVLVRDRPTIVLIKVHNEAGVTHPLKVSGPQLRTANQKEEGRWLDVAVESAAPLAEKLSGQKVEYVVIRLTARETGKREATLAFDVGQGTQDLGFRAEVPILFAVRPKD